MAEQIRRIDAGNRAGANLEKASEAWPGMTMGGSPFLRDGIYAGEIAESLGVVDGTQRYHVLIATGQSQTKNFHVKYATVVDQDGDALGVGEKVTVRIQAGEPPLILSGSGSGSGGSLAEHYHEYFLIGEQ